MIRIDTSIDFFNEFLLLEGMNVVDVGCGNGDLVRWFSSRGACAYGVDQENMVKKALKEPTVNGAEFIIGGGEQLPLAREFGDLIVYMASFHHIPIDSMEIAMKECYRVLKNGGEAFFVEPIYEEGTYSQLIELLEDERDIQKAALDVLDNAEKFGFTTLDEEIYYFERSIEDYKKMLQLHVDDIDKMMECISSAEKITEKLAAEKSIPVSEYRYKSVCRLRKLKKK